MVDKIFASPSEVKVIEKSEPSVSPTTLKVISPTNNAADEELEKLVLEVIDAAKEPLSVLPVRQKLNNKYEKKDVNRVLYNLKETGVIKDAGKNDKGQPMYEKL